MFATVASGEWDFAIDEKWRIQDVQRFSDHKVRDARFRSKLGAYVLRDLVFFRELRSAQKRSPANGSFEGATGVMMTYTYQLAKGDEVYVLDQVIHIPARCIKQVPGNAIRCGRS